MKFKSEWCRGCQLAKKPVLLASLTVFLTGGVTAIISSQQMKLESYGQAERISSPKAQLIARVVHDVDELKNK